MNAIRSHSNRAATERVFVVTAVLVLAGIVIGTGSARGQTFDCQTARTADEVTICHEPGLAKLDQDLSGLRHQRNQAKRDDGEDNEIPFLNARRRCGENLGCIEQSYRNRIEELARSLSEQKYERLPPPPQNSVETHAAGRG